MATKVCPPKHLKEWSELIKLAGSESEAYRWWIGYGENIPTKEQLVKDKLIEPLTEPLKFQVIINNLEQQKRTLYKNLIGLRNTLKKNKNNKVVDDKIKATEKKIESITDRIDQLSKTQVIKDALKYAEEDYKYVSDVLNKKNLSFTDLNNIKRIIKLWVKAGDLSKNHIFLTKEELDGINNKDNENYEIGRLLKDNQILFEELASIYHERSIQLMESFLKTTFKGGIDVELDVPLKDITKLQALTLDLGEMDNILLEAMSKWRKTATFRTHKEAKEIIEGLDDVFNNLRESGYNIKEIQDLFSQRVGNNNNKRTGNLVFRYTQDFFDYTRSLRRQRDNNITEAERNNDASAVKEIYRKYNDTMKKNTILLDPRILIPNNDLYSGKFNIKEVENYKEELIKNLGKKGYEFYLERLNNQVEEYKKNRKEREEEYKDLYDDEKLLQDELLKWEYRNSPYYAAENFADNTVFKVSGEFIRPSQGLSTVPRRYINGKETGFYDKNFDKIENDPKLLALHTYLIDTLKELNQFLPEDMQNEMHINTLPFLEKTIVEQFATNKMKEGFAPIWDWWKKSITSKPGSRFISGSYTDVGGEVERKLSVDYIPNIKKYVNDYIERKSIEYKLANNSLPKFEDKELWRQEAENELAQERSFDLEKIFKAYTLSVIGFKHKAMVEDALNIAQDIINNSKEQDLNNAGDTIMDERGIKSKEGLYNMKQAVDYFMDSLYGMPPRENEMIIKDKKKYTKKEFEIKTKLEKLKEENKKKVEAGEITKKEFVNTERELDTQLKALGGVVTGSKIGDQLNMWVRLRGLGWNLFSPIMNLSVGYVTNIIEASGGRVFNRKEAIKAYYDTFFSQGKMANLMERFDTLKEIQNEIKKSAKAKKRYNWLSPFYLQGRSEYLNQAPVMGAMMQHIKIKQSDGTEISLWDVYDNDGNIKKGIEVTEEMEEDFKAKLDKAIKNIHGNYDPDSPILANKTILGRSLMVFRKWMINSYYNRIRKEAPSHISGLVEKGRWRSYGAYFEEYGTLGALFDTIQQLAKKLTFGIYNTNFDNRLNEVDAANMRKNMTELMSLISISSLGLLLKALTKGEDDDQDWKYLAFFWINNLNRLEMDLRFYLDPEQFKKILRDPLPVMGLVGDVTKVLYRTGNLITGGEDEYQSGIHKGNSKTWVATKNLAPISNIGNRFKTLSTQIIQK